MKLTIGMAHFDDFHGAVFSIQSIRMSNAFKKHDIEIVVIDNSPNSNHGKALQQFCQKVGAKYFAFANSTGTTQTRQSIFDVATGDAVLCMDCHVLFFPEGIERLIEFYTKNPKTKNLYSGPLYLDNMNEISTHFDLLWRGQMWGVWGYSRQCKCGYVFSYQPAADFNYLEDDLYLSMETTQKDLKGTCPKCNADLRAYAHNRQDCSLDTEPFQIPSQGLGIFTCMKDAWLGFNPNFRQFGGEEGYIHHKYEQAGHKTMCLPFLGWWHRFARPDGVKYPMSLESRVKNYVHGFKELGLPIKEIKNHFINNDKSLTEETWDNILLTLNDNLEIPPSIIKKDSSYPKPKSKCCNNPEKCNKKSCNSGKRPLEHGDVATTSKNGERTTIRKLKVPLSEATLEDLYKMWQKPWSKFLYDNITETKSKSVGIYCHSADIIFASMAPEKIKKYYCHHVESDQNNTLMETLSEKRKDLKTYSNSYHGSLTEKVDTLIVASYASKEELFRMMNQKDKVNKEIFVMYKIGATMREVEDALHRWNLLNNDFYLVSRTVSPDENTILVKFSKDKKLAAKAKPVHLLRIGDSAGPGTELKKLLKLIGITASPTCNCNQRAAMMDAMGPEWCENNIETILDWLKEEAAKRKSPFIKAGAKLIVKRAIKRSKKALAEYVKTNG